MKPPQSVKQKELNVCGWQAVSTLFARHPAEVRRLFFDAKAKDADLWIGVGSFRSLNEIKAAEARYGLFKPFSQKQVYSYDARKGAKGGSEFLELGYLRPDLILKDLVKIGHPELLPEHELFFHRRLE